MTKKMLSVPFLGVKRGMLVILAAVLAVIMQTTPADASIQLRIAGEDLSFTTRTLVDQGSGVFTYMNTEDIGGAEFDLDITITTNSPGTSTLAELLTVQVSARENGNGSANHLLYFEVTDDTFTQPIGTDLVLNSEYTGSFSNQNNTGSLTSTVLNSALTTVLASVGPHGLGTSGTDTFDNVLPFALRNLTFIELNSNASSNTSSRTWVEGNGDPGVIPEPATIIVWSLLGITAVCGSRNWRKPC